MLKKIRRTLGAFFCCFMNPFHEWTDNGHRTWYCRTCGRLWENEPEDKRW